MQSDSAFKFLEIAYNLKQDRNHPAELEFYRGHSDKTWRLIPTLYRNYMTSFEYNLYSEFARLRPDQFHDGEGVFNNLAKMQHYGLHTRLLDITENPAVALYFACNDNLDKDGEVFTFQEHLDDMPSNTVLNIIAEFYMKFKIFQQGESVEDYYNWALRQYKANDVNSAFYYILIGISCVARPRIISERILRQSGASMLIADRVCPRENCNIEKCIKKESGCRRDRIPKEVEQMVKIARVGAQSEDFTERHVKYVQNCFRYIIQAENKKRILSELEMIGIKNSFIFPELVSTGANIMNDYYSRVTN